uniref:NADH-ubiquinone oxidoreductase chain 5 n=1 Tax=Callulina kreffti TaxID=248777 RepID=S4V214_9NEOB|nr:NADH dehydrogenase subunit 5 [Callulina kreffti]
MMPNLYNVTLYAPLASTLVIFIPLLIPSFLSKNLYLGILKAVKFATYISAIPAMSLIFGIYESSTFYFPWLSLVTSNVNVMLQFDTYSMIFIPIALFVTSQIMQFSVSYMKSDPLINTFFKYLLIFLLMMIILVSSANLIIFFFAWEGVGLMSFLLIGWYHARISAGIAALQAMIYNRIGDIGFVFAMCLLITQTSSLSLLTFSNNMSTTLTLILFITAAASKSAQFILHPWLASAMEGPTPVSALLHSSTMVVAGIFLLIRIFPLMEDNQTALTVCLCLGSVSTAYAATTALMQNDMKKIIAYSTSSQLGLMMVSIGLGLPQLAFFHMCAHAFFKALLFLSSGSIIHNLDNEQDIRKMGGLRRAMPITTSCVTIASLALMGIPFLTGFYSKDAIIEAMNTSPVNISALIITLIAVSFTAVYSLRLVYFMSLTNPRINPTVIINENDSNMTNPLFELCLFAISMGFFLSQLFLPSQPMIHTMPMHVKLAALFITILALYAAIDLAKHYWTKQTGHKLLNPSIFHLMIHRLFPYSPLKIAEILMTRLANYIWLKLFGPEGLTSSQLSPMKKLQKFQKGMINSYLATISTSLALSMFLIWLLY